MTNAVFWGILQGEGRMKYVMRSMIVATAANVILDPIFIFALGLKVQGAALATVLAQLLSLLYLVAVFLGNKSQVEVEWKIANIHLPTVARIYRIGFPQATGMIIMSLSFLTFNRLMVDIDQLAFTAFTLCGRMDQAVLLPSFAIAAALILTAPLFYPFFSSNRTVVDYAVVQTRVLSFTFVLAVFTILARSFFQGVGKSMPALVIPVLRLVVLAVPAAYLFVFVFGLGAAGVWLGIGFGNAASALVSFLWVANNLKTLKYKYIRS